MDKINYDYARIAYNRFITDLKKRFPKNLSSEEVNNRLKMFDYVSNYTSTLVNAGDSLMTSLTASDSIKEFTKIAILNHDIGRFEQIRLYGSLDDSILASELGINNHGELGDLLLTDLVKIEIPDTRLQMPIRRIVRNHVNKELDESSLGILSNTEIINGELEDILVGNEQQSRFVDAITLLVRDLENLEVYLRLFGDNHGRNSLKLSNSFNVKYNEALAKVKSLHL